MKNWSKFHKSRFQLTVSESMKHEMYDDFLDKFSNEISEGRV